MRNHQITQVPEDHPKKKTRIVKNHKKPKKRNHPSKDIRNTNVAFELTASGRMSNPN